MEMTEAFFVRTDPASSIVNPAHIHMTSAPQTRNADVLSTNPVSAPTGVCAMADTGRSPRIAASPSISSSICMMIVYQPFVSVLSNVTTEPKESILHEDRFCSQVGTEDQRAVIPQRHRNHATNDLVRRHKGT